MSKWIAASWLVGIAGVVVYAAWPGILVVAGIAAVGLTTLWAIAVLVDYFGGL